MNEVVVNIMKEKPIIIPQELFKNYKKLNITEEELIVLICLINEGDKIVYNPTMVSDCIDMDKYKVMQIINDLFEKQVINIKVENNLYGKKEEYIYLDILYNKLFNLILDKQNGNVVILDSNLFNLFETELGRTLSPMEVEIIKEWTNDGMSEELIKEALKEAISNDVRNLKYIDRILFNWRVKGFKTKNDVLKEKKNYRKAKKNIDTIYDYNWLEEEE